MRRTYGNEKTYLILCTEAYEVYCDTDPLTIYEIEDDEDGTLTYDITGAIEATGLNAEDVNYVLVDFGRPHLYIGMTYEDPEGLWKIVGFRGEDVLVECIASKAVFSDIMSVSQDEVLHFLSQEWRG